MEQVNYEGRTQKLWRPTGIAAGWQPFTVGRWTVWSRDNVWIPEESFGYVTHHYGNWVFINSAWYWAPPGKVRVGSTGGRPYWYPGRVSWIHSDADVGGSRSRRDETYYSHNYWGPGSFIVGGRRGGIGIGRLAYAGHAVVVPRGSLYSVNSYTGVRVANMNRTTIINNYTAAPVISDRVIPNYSSIRYRYVYNVSLAHLPAKPHQAVLDRINRNRMIAPKGRRTISAVAVQRNLARIDFGKPVRDPQAVQRVQKLRITSRIVPESQVHRPRSEVKFVQRALKAHGKRHQRRPGLYGPGAQQFRPTCPARWIR